MTPASDTTAYLGMLLSMYLDLTFRHVRLGGAGRPLVADITAIDSSSMRLRETGPGTLFANFHVVARVSR